VKGFRFQNMSKLLHKHQMEDAGSPEYPLSPIRTLNPGTLNPKN